MPPRGRGDRDTLAPPTALAVAPEPLPDHIMTVWENGVEKQLEMRNVLDRLGGDVIDGGTASTDDYAVTIDGGVA